jgi:hypothetical protein
MTRRPVSTQDNTAQRRTYNHASRWIRTHNSIFRVIQNVRGLIDRVTAVFFVFHTSRIIHILAEYDYSRLYRVRPWFIITVQPQHITTYHYYYYFPQPDVFLLPIQSVGASTSLIKIVFGFLISVSSLNKNNCSLFLYHLFVFYCFLLWLIFFNFSAWL